MSSTPGRPSLGEGTKREEGEGEGEREGEGEGEGERERERERGKGKGKGKEKESVGGKDWKVAVKSDKEATGLYRSTESILHGLNRRWGRM